MTEHWAIVIVAVISMMTTIITAITTNAKSKDRLRMTQRDLKASQAESRAKLEEVHGLVNSRNEVMVQEIARLRATIDELQRQRYQRP